ncbi:MAG: TetR/AcrR family transcriptional regulator [Thermoleophilia bacterium]|nr:TetR/AcrR family transcriptional regulator [Thermoleophilia bacterium]
MTPAAAARLPAAERRHAIVEAALAVFSAHSYTRSTTAEIARAAGVSEPVLYRHFPSKRDLYLACLDESWTLLRTVVETTVAATDDPREWPLAIADAVDALRARKCLPSHLWIQALSEAGGDPEIRRHMRSHMREVHDYFRDLLARAQEAGGVAPDRDADAEAWIVVAIGLLRAVEDTLGGVLPPDQFAAIATARRRWLTAE